MTRILGIESSCDETAASVVSGDREILSSIVLSQIDIHKAYGGVVPEIAARSHLDAIRIVVNEALEKANMELGDVDAIAATAGPGLIGGVIVGLTTAKAMALALGKPFIAVNHLEGHALVPRLCNERLGFPYLLLLASGGHTQFLIAKGVGDYELLGSTIDDAAGEAFDKVAKMLGLGYPGGPLLEKLALEGDGNAFAFPVALKGKEGCDFSFSGLKTAVRFEIEKHKDMSRQTKADIAASFQKALISSVIDRLGNAVSMYKDRCGVNAKMLVVAGGVAANQAIRKALQDCAARNGLGFDAPPLKLCTDNGAMIAWAGCERFAGGMTDTLDVRPRPRWPLDE